VKVTHTDLRTHLSLDIFEYQVETWSAGGCFFCKSLSNTQTPPPLMKFLK